VKKPLPAHGPRESSSIVPELDGQRILGREGPMPLADFERVIRINLIGTST
jgi:hypothetical protein